MKFSRHLLVVLATIFLFSSFALTQDSQQPSPGDTDALPSPSSPADEIQTFGPGSGDEEKTQKQQEGQEAESKSSATPEEKTAEESNAPNEYIIVVGDNLWDICSRFLGNPFEWPKLWSINEYISNPHYIYPGGKLVFKPGSEVAPPRMEMARDEAAKPAEETLPEVAEEMARPKKAESKKVEEDKPLDAYVLRMKNLSFISPKELQYSGKISHSVESKKLLCTGDKVYLQLKDMKNAAIGDRFSVFDTVQKIEHPKSGKNLGYEIYNKGTVKVTVVDKFVLTGIITNCSDSMGRGDRIIPYSDPIRKITPKELDKEVNGYIVGSEQRHRLIGIREYTYIDKGLKQGIENGSLFYVVRRGDGMGSSSDKKLPLIIVGKIIVVEAKENTSTAYVIDSNKDLAVGDSIKSKL